MPMEVIFKQMNQDLEENDHQQSKREPWELWFEDRATGNNISLTTGSGIEAPSAQQLFWSARNMSLSSKFELALPVIESGTVRYNFSTFGGDICFQVCFIPKKDSQTEISNILKERTREQSHAKPIMGEIIVPEAGTLRLSWDNYGAPWRLERKLSYSVNLYYPGSADMKNEMTNSSKIKLNSFIGVNNILLSRQDHLLSFIHRCAITQQELENRIQKLNNELEQVKETKLSANNLSIRINNKMKSNRYQIIILVLNLVTQAGWLS